MIMMQTGRMTHRWRHMPRSHQRFEKQIEIAEVLTLTYFPPVLLFWHRRLQSKQCCCPGFGQRELAVAPEGEKLDIKEGAVMAARADVGL